MVGTEHLRQSHPAFRNVTRENLTEHFALGIPSVLQEGYALNDALTCPAVVSSVAGDLGVLVMQHFAKKELDSNLYFCIGDYLVNQVLKTRNPAIQQVVIMDMIMDVRAFYLPELQNCRVFDLQRNAVVMAEKERLLRLHDATLVAKERHSMLADPRKDGWQHILLSHGFDPEEPTCWIMGSYLTYMTNAGGSHLVDVVAALSAPGSQIYADKFNGHTVKFAKDQQHIDDAMTIRSYAFFEMHGDSGLVFQSLSNWRVELLLRRDSNLEYFGTMWDPEKLEAWRIADPDIGYLGPWFCVRFSLPDQMELPGVPESSSGGENNESD